MYLLIDVGSGGRENNWPSVMVALTSLCSFHVPWPWRKYFPVQRVVQSHGLTKPPVGRSYFVFAVQPYHSVNKYMTLEKGSFQGSLTVHWYYNHHKFKLYYGCCFFWKLYVIFNQFYFECKRFLVQFCFHSKAKLGENYGYSNLWLS